MAKIPESNVNVSDIGNVLKAAGGIVNVNQALTFFTADAKINKWAYNKPEAFKKDFDLTSQERYQNNHGFDTSQIANQSVSSLFANAKAGNIWLYKLPTGSANAPFRLGDFKGYNTAAQPPFDYHWISSSAANVNGTYSDTWRVLLNDGAEIKMTDLGIFDTYNAKNYLFICRKASGSSYTYIKSTLVPMANNPSEIQCSINIPSTGTWECLFCMGQDTSESIESRTDLIVLPDGYFTFTLSKTTVYINVVYVSPALSNGYYDESTYSFYLGSFIKLTLQASDTSQSVPSTELKFGFIMQLLDGNGNLMAESSLYSDDGNDYYTYSGTEKKDWNIQNFPSPIYLPNYFDESKINNASKLRMQVDIKAIGQGVPSMPLTYYDYTL